MPTAIELAEQFQASLVGDGSCRLRGLETEKINHFRIRRKREQKRKKKRVKKKAKD